MPLKLHPKFLDALAGLSEKDQKRVRATLQQILQDGSQSGLRLHKVGEFWSFSATMSLRILGVMQGSDTVLLHVDQHDLAYQWARKNRPIRATNGALIGVSLGVGTEEDLDLATARASQQVVDEAHGRYLALGLPHSFAAFLCRLDEDELLDAISLLDVVFQEAILEARVGTASSVAPRPLPAGLVLVENDDELRFALSLPEERWRLFLHPKQRFAVDLPSDRGVLLRGGPGTGKTVTLLHRFKRLLHEGGVDERRPVLVALNDATREVLLNGLSALGVDDAKELVIESAKLNRGTRDLQGGWSSYSSILVDEAQDLPIGYVSQLVGALEGGDQSVPPHFLAFDGNQAIVSPSAHALSRLEHFFDTVSLRYSYRATRENVAAGLAVQHDLTRRFRGKDFKHDHEIRATRDKGSVAYLSPITGPQVTVGHQPDQSALISDVRLAVRQLKSAYVGSATVPVIVIAHPPDAEILDSIATVVETYTPRSVKGHEFFAGVVVDWLEYEDLEDLDEPTPITSGRYRSIAGLYVALTRFRDSVHCLYRSPRSPLRVLKESTHEVKERP